MRNQNIPPQNESSKEFENSKAVKGQEKQFEWKSGFKVFVNQNKKINKETGSLFEFRDSNNNIIGAGFQNSYSTYLRGKRRILNFFIASPKRPLTHEILPHPFAEYSKNKFQIAYNTRLTVLSNKLIAFPQHSSSTSKILERGRWKKKPSFALEDNEIRGIRIIDGRDVLFAKDSILVNREIIFKQKLTNNSYFYDRELIIFSLNEVNNESTIYRCDWNPSKKLNIDECMHFKLGKAQGSAYAILRFNEELMFATSRGNIFRLRKNLLEKIFDREVLGPNVSWQAYSFLEWYEKILIGQYPSGSLFGYDGKTIEPFQPDIPAISGAKKNQREAQTISVFAGELYVGVWPWGELWKLNRFSTKWELVERLFTDPAPSDEEAPFYNKLHNSKPPQDSWGQRITSILPFENSLYVSTANKTKHQEEFLKAPFLTSTILSQYGAVHRFSGPIQLSCEVTDKERLDLNFEIKGSLLTIKQDGQTICENTFSSLPFLLKRGTITEGFGVYGAFLHDLNVTGN